MGLHIVIDQTRFSGGWWPELETKSNKPICRLRTLDQDIPETAHHGTSLIKKLTSKVMFARPSLLQPRTNHSHKHFIVQANV